MNWNNSALLVKEIIMAILGESKIKYYSIRSVNQQCRDIFDRINTEHQHFIEKLKIHFTKNANILHMCTNHYNIRQNALAGQYVNIIVCFKGIHFKDYDRLKCPNGKFGMIYRLDGGDLNFYEGIHASTIKRMNEHGILFEFTILCCGYKEISFAFYYNDGIHSGIFNDNDGQSFYYKINDCI